MTNGHVLAGSAAVVVHVNSDGVLGVADRRLFGSFVEHLGRGVYGGVYDPEHPSADGNGFRADVLALVKELGVTTVRYPGGNFVSGYNWRDGIGPRSERPRRLDLAWKSIETNQFGTDEFIDWCRAADVEPMLALNLGLGNVREALQLLEYVNHPGGTDLSDLRAANGHPSPHNVKLWCLGNELDGPWQLGAKSSGEYAALAASAANAMRMFDADLELIAVGSSNAEMPTFGTWERDVLETNVALVDFLSCHIYFYDAGDTTAFLASSDKLDAFLSEIESIITDAKAANPGARDVKISLDEWNVWNYHAYDEQAPLRSFEVAPRILEDEYTLLDAVVVGSLLQTILSHADTVAIAAIAQLVNVIGPIRTEADGQAWRQTTFYPFSAAALSSGWSVLRTRSSDADVQVTVTRSPDFSAYNIYTTNKDEVHERTVEVPLPPTQVVDAWALFDEDLHATNTQAAPNRVTPRALKTEAIDGGVRIHLPAVSWAFVQLRALEGEAA